MIHIVDYGAGNLRSVQNAVESLGREVVVVTGPEGLSAARAIILPGVGAYGDCYGALAQAGFIPALNECVLQRKIPFLGICLGMQLMAERGLEHGSFPGLGWVKGTIRAIEPPTPEIRVPHMGWNDVAIKRSSPILHDIKDGSSFYFVHSYFLPANDSDPDAIIGTTEHGESIGAVIGRDNFFGVQFHPEKSQQNGLKLIKNFLEFAQT